MAKKTDREIVVEALATLKSYNKTISQTQKFLSDESLEDTLKATLQVTLRMATENRDSAVGTIFRRIAEHVGAEEKSIESFVLKIFPSPAPETPAQIAKKV